MLESGASMNFYMFHGGTNFGFMNGANDHGEIYRPTITSYDYNALVSECGDLTPAYHKVRAIIEKHFNKKLPTLTVKDSEKAAYGKVQLTEKAFILDSLSALSEPVYSSAPMCQEDLGQNYGFTLYSSTVTGPREPMQLGFDFVHDRAIVYIDGVRAGIIERDRRCDPIKIDLGTNESVKMDILLENMGRTNYGPSLADRKGITGIRFERQNHFGWTHYPMEMKDLSKLVYSPCDGGVEGSHFMRGTLVIEGEPKDTFVRLDGFHHGFVTVNGFNLGRYYNDAGPQKTLYCPAPMLRSGVNEVIVFETDSSETNVIEFTDIHDLG